MTLERKKNSRYVQCNCGILEQTCCSAIKNATVFFLDSQGGWRRRGDRVIVKIKFTLYILNLVESLVFKSKIWNSFLHVSVYNKYQYFRPRQEKRLWHRASLRTIVCWKWSIRRRRKNERKITKVIRHREKRRRFQRLSNRARRGRSGRNTEVTLRVTVTAATPTGTSRWRSRWRTHVLPLGGGNSRKCLRLIQQNSAFIPFLDIVFSLCCDTVGCSIAGSIQHVICSQFLEPLISSFLVFYVTFLVCTEQTWPIN